MEAVTVTFDRVFGAVKFGNYSRGSLAALFQDGSPYTVFGFETSSGRQYNVHVPKCPVIEPGMTVTAVLRKPGDWSSTFGWVNHASGELVHMDIGLYLILPLAFMAGLVYVLFMYFSGEHTIGIVWSAMLMALGVVPSTIYAINSIRLKRELFKVAAPFRRHATT